MVSPEIPPGAQRFSDTLLDISTDRARAPHGEKGEVSVPEISLADIPAEHHETVLANLEALHHLNGHRGSMVRDRVLSGTTPLATHLRALYEWSKSPSSIEPICAPAPEGFLALGDSPEHLYEALTFLELHPDVTPETYGASVAEATAAALGLPEGKTKWVDGISPTFNAKDRARVFTKLFADVGFLPEELTTKKAFQKVPTTSLFASVEALRTLEGGEYADEARHERARLLNAMIAGGNLLQLHAQGGDITLDANGIFINVGALHAHLPYGLIEEPAFAALTRDGWLSDEAAAEAGLRTLNENNTVSEIEKVKQDQLERFIESIKDSEQETALVKDIAKLRALVENNTASENQKHELLLAEGSLVYTRRLDSLEGVVTQIVNNPQYFAKKVIKGNHIIPDMVIDALGERGPDGISTLARFGESISEELANKSADTNQTALGANDFASHELLKIPEIEYERRSAIINSPEYYNAHKMLRGILAAKTKTSEQDEFIVLRSAYKRVKNGDQHSFVEVLNKGEMSRVLINENKELDAPLRRAFEELPLYERDAYEDLERAVTTYKSFARDLERLRSTKGMSITGYQDYEFWRIARDVLGFLSGHASPERFRTASDLFDKLEAAVHDESYTTMGKYAEEFVVLVEQCDEEYRKFLYASIGKPINFTEAFMPEIAKTDVAFGSRFAEEAREKCAPGGYDEKLSATEANVRVVSLDYKESDPTASIPFHVEAEALNALRLSPRKFLNIAGGARLMEGRDQDAMSAMIGDILGVAHEHQLNVAVPGTQIGIGRLFGAANTAYRAQHGHLPLAKQARLFAVSPGGNTYYPGNPYLTPEFTSQTYAMSPVDTIVTPFSVDWDAKGLAKRDSLYLNHVAYMEALYDRIGRGNQRAMLMLNGGLYTLLEATEAYRRGFPLILAEDSGRLAQVLSEYVRLHGGDGPTSETEPDEMYNMIMSAVEKLPKEVAQEFTEKDFGRAAQAENDDYIVYREYLYRLLKVIEYNRWSESKSGVSQITTMKSAEITQYLKDFYARDFAGNSRGPAPIPSIKKWESSYWDKPTKK